MFNVYCGLFLLINFRSSEAEKANNVLSAPKTSYENHSNFVLWQRAIYVHVCVTAHVLVTVQVHVTVHVRVTAHVYMAAYMTLSDLIVDEL